MIFNPSKHRRSIRLKGYDYSKEGAYFVTICVQDRNCLFGDVINGEMKLNEAGKMVQNWWSKLPQKYAYVELDEFIVMPNHLHGIIIAKAHVGADPCVCPDNEATDLTNLENQHNQNGIILGNHMGDGVGDHMGKPMGEHMGSPQRMGSPQHTGSLQRDHMGDGVGDHMGKPMGEHMGSPQRMGSPQQMPISISRAIQWFKTMTTNEYIRNVKNFDWPPFNKRLWQRNYYEHIVRNEHDYNRIKKYIIENPLKWKNDSRNPVELISKRS